METMSLPESTLDPQALKNGMTPELCAQLVRQHGGMVLGACRRILRDDSLAQDAAQETFLLLIQKARQVPAQASLAGWLYQAACRISQNHQRTLVRRQQREAAFVTTSLMHAPTDAPWQELEPQLDAAMLTLPERQRDLVVQCYFQQQSQRQAAQSLGLSESVVSRELTRAIESLRSFFKKRGLGITATSLIALLGANAVEAATLSTASLSSLLSAAKQAAATTAAPGLLSLITLAAVKAPLALGLLALLAGLTSYDLASERSLLSEWWTSATKSASAQTLATTQSQTTLASAPNKEQLLAEARDIWARARKSDLSVYSDSLDLFLKEADPDKLYTTMKSAGINVSRTSFDRIFASMGKEKNQFERNIYFWEKLLKAWCDESPREAIALNYVITSAYEVHWKEMSRFISMSAHTFSRYPAAWEAFWEVSPDPRLAGLAKLWQREVEDPGMIWTQAKTHDINESILMEYLSRTLQEAAPETGLQLVLRCPDATLKKKALLGLTERLDAETLSRLSHEVFAGDAGLANVLLAIAGDSSASHQRAAQYLKDTTAHNEQFYSVIEWAESSRRALYAQWLKGNVAEAMRLAIGSEDSDHWGSYMKDAVKTGILDESIVVESLAGVAAEKRDQALAAFYLEEADGDHQKTLLRITESAHIEDQIEAAKPALARWTLKSPEDAAAWLTSLPPTEDHRELAALVAEHWSWLDPVKSLAFIHEQGIGLKHGLAQSLIRGWLKEPEASANAMLQSFRQEPEYDELVVNYAFYHLPSHPEQGIQFLKTHVKGHWQTYLVENITRWIKTGDTRLESYQPMLPKVDLSEVPPQKMKALNEALAKQRTKAASKP